MRNKLILAGMPSILRMLAPKLCDPVPQENCRLMYTAVSFSDLIALSWKYDVAYENGNSYKMNQIGSELLMVGDHERRMQEYHLRHKRLYPAPSYLPARPGDFIVIMPMVGGNSKNPADFPCSASDDHMRRSLRFASVILLYIGEKLPQDVEQVYSHLRWHPLCLESVDDPLAAAIKKNSDKRISVFDAHRLGFCVPGIERFQKRYFPGRVDCTVGELAQHVDAQPEVRTALERFLNLKARLTWEQEEERRLAVKKQRAPLAKALGLTAWL